MKRACMLAGQQHTLFLETNKDKNGNYLLYEGNRNFLNEFLSNLNRAIRFKTTIIFKCCCPVYAGLKTRQKKLSVLILK